jgi:hypothetical protein
VLEVHVQRVLGDRRRFLGGQRRQHEPGLALEDRAAAEGRVDYREDLRQLEQPEEDVVELHRNPQRAQLVAEPLRADPRADLVLDAVHRRAQALAEGVVEHALDHGVAVVADGADHGLRLHRATPTRASARSASRLSPTRTRRRGPGVSGC